MTRDQKIFLLLVLALPLGLLLPFIGYFAYPLHSNYSDVTISHYPNLLYLQRSLLMDNRLPLWSNAILSGYPFYANPLSGMWYPPLWLAILLPGPTGLNLVVILHLYLGSLGMSLFIFEKERCYWAAILAGVAFGSIPKVLAHFAAGHISMVCAVMWTPWLLWIESRRHKANGNLETFVLSGSVLGAIALADLRWAAYAGALWLAYYGRVQVDVIKARLAGFEIKEIGREMGYQVAQVIGTIGIALVISAPQLIPLLRYSAQTTREYLSASDNLSFALPLSQLITLLFADIGGYAEWVVYPGALTLLLFVWTLMDGRTWKKDWFWVVVLGLSGLYALGEVFPPNRLIASLPGFSLLRVPSRAVFISNLALIVLASRATMQILDESADSENETKRRYQQLAITVVVMLAVVLPLALWLLGNQLPFEMIWGAIIFLMAFLLFLLVAHQKFKGQIAGGILLAVLVLDVGLVNHCGTDYWTFSRATAQANAAAAYLAGQDGVFRVYSPSYSIPQHTAALYGLQTADGIDPLQLKAYADYMLSATGVDVPGYSVTIPPFKTGRPASDNAGAVPDVKLLGKLNVRFVAAEFDLAASGLLPVARFGNTRIYENKEFYPRMWIQPAGFVAQTEIRNVSSLEIQPDRISAMVQGPGMVVASEVMYPGWKAMVDGKPVNINTVDGLFRGVEIPAGEHFIEFYFQPTDLYAGVMVGVLAWVFLAGCFLAKYRRR